MSLDPSHASTDGGSNPGCDSSRNVPWRVLQREIVTSIEIFQLQCSQASGMRGKTVEKILLRAVDLETAHGRSCHRMRESIDLG